MGFLLIVKNIVLFTGLTLILPLLTPLRRRMGWKTPIMLLLIGLALGVWSARRGLDDWMIDHVKEYRANPARDLPARYVLGDFIPAKKLLGGGLPVEARAFVAEMAASEDYCLRAMAREIQGERVDVSGECARQAERPRAAAAENKP